MRGREGLRWGAALAAMSAVLGLLTLVRPDWVETFVHLDPDGGSGTLERAVAVLCLGAAAGLALRARRGQRRSSTRRQRGTGDAEGVRP